MSQSQGAALPMSSVSPQSSASPLIASEPQQPSAQIKVDAPAEEKDPKTGKRRFFGLGKKKDSKASASSSSPSASGTPSPGKMTSSGSNAGASLSQPVSPGTVPSDLRPQQPRSPVSPSRQAYPSAMAASPSRLRSSSPRLHSPASSEIFERNVQEPAQITTLQNELSPAHIPAHVITEDRIPPALEASAQAITSDDLDPDDVEIVMSTSHQPAAVPVLEGSHADLQSLNSPLHKVRSEDSEGPSALHHSGILQPGIDEDSASNYGQLDPTDVRRLSFISFADIVQSEHMPPPGFGDPGSRDSLHIASLPTSVKDAAEARAASPLRASRSPGPAQNAGVTTPPLCSSGVLQGLRAEQSPVRSATSGSPLAQHGELTIETMTQAVRKTASGDLGGVRSAGMSPVSDEGVARSRTGS